MIELTIKDCVQIQCALGILYSRTFSPNRELIKKIKAEHEKLLKNESPNCETDNLIP